MRVAARSSVALLAGSVVLGLVGAGTADAGPVPTGATAARGADSAGAAGRQESRQVGRWTVSRLGPGSYRLTWHPGPRPAQQRRGFRRRAYAVRGGVGAGAAQRSRRAGTHAITSTDYDLAPVRLPGISRLSEMVGHVVSPADATEASPLVLFLHGGHDACYTSAGTAADGSPPAIRAAETDV